MVQTLARCRSCGVPVRIAECLEWQPGGEITIRRAKPLRLALLDARTMDDIVAGVTSVAGEDACVEAKKAATRTAAGRFVTGIRGKLSRYGAVKKRVLEAMESYSLLLGMGRIEVERLTPGEGGSLILRRPFEKGMVMAGIAGLLEEMDRCRYTGSLSVTGDDVYRLDLAVDESRGPVAGSPHEEALFRETRHGGAGYESCRLCGLPLSISPFLWDELYGVVDAGAGGRRVAFVPAYVLDTLGRLVRGEGDKGTEAFIEEAVFASTLGSLAGGTKDAYEGAGLLAGESCGKAALDIMRTRGWGAVAGDSLDGGEWRVEILDPVHDALVAGWLRAVYTVALGKEPKVEVREEPPYTVFEMG